MSKRAWMLAAMPIVAGFTAAAPLAAEPAGSPAPAAGRSAPGAAVVVAAVDGSFLRPYDNVWRFTARLPDGTIKFQGLWTDHVDMPVIDGATVARRVQGMTWLNGLTSSTVNLFDPRTFAPISSEQRTPQGALIHRDFHGGDVSARHVARPGEKERLSEAHLGAPLFDFWGGMYGLLLAGLPLREGYAAALPAIAEFEEKAQPIAAKVVRRERVSAGALGKVEAWVVDCEGMTFWLTKTPPYVIRLRMADPQNRVMTWEML